MTTGLQHRLLGVGSVHRRASLEGARCGRLVKVKRFRLWGKEH